VSSTLASEIEGNAAVEIESRIQILDETTANQIAAGEVVERPASAVKELVENALDAGATQVTVELQEGGKRLIRVTDNGEGMTQEEAILSLQRHATSKIQNADDLFRITTMGFRGEALPSIASVSHFYLTTRSNRAADDAAGTEIVCIGGSMESVRDVGARIGTSIAVEDLFYNVPARLKFLKSTATEVGHATDLLQAFALSYPATAFRLTHNDHEIFTSNGDGSSFEACVQVYGKEMARNLFPIDYSASGLRVTGYIGSPATLRGTRAFQHLFVNRRGIRSKSMMRALDDAFRSVQTLHGTRYPTAVIQVEVDPGQVDVNVSPTKTEVRFTRDGEVFSAVYNAVKEALMAGGLVPNIAGSAWPGQQTSPGNSLFGGRSSFGSSTGYRNGQHGFADRLTFTPPDISHSTFDRVQYPDQQTSETPPQSIAEGPAAVIDGPTSSEPVSEMAERPPFVERAPEPAAPPVDFRRQRLDGLRVLAQSRNTYIIAQTNHALLLIDQHVAHERVLYERLVAGAEGGGTGVPVQRLAIPITLELTRREAIVVEKRLEELRKSGFELEPFGQDTFLVRSVPASVAQKSLKVQMGAEATLRAIVEEMVEKTVSRRLLLPSEEVLITASCKMAVKAGDPLSMEEMNALIRDLLKSENPYTCPHGRPIIVELPNGDIDRKFGR